MRWRAAFGTLLLGSACFADLLVGPEPNANPTLGVSVQARQDEAIRYSVSGLFAPGSDSAGVQRAMVDSFMLVADIAIQGVRSADRLGMIYTWSDSISSMPRDTLPIRGPTVEAQVSPTTTILLGLPTRTDASFRDHVVGDDVQLNVSALGETPYGFGSDFGGWRLEIRNARQNVSLLSLQGLAPPNLPIVVPWSLVQAVAGDSLSATLQTNSTFASQLTAYPTFLHVFVQLTWRMRIVAAPTP